MVQKRRNRRSRDATYACVASLCCPACSTWPTRPFIVLSEVFVDENRIVKRFPFPSVCVHNATLFLICSRWIIRTASANTNSILCFFHLWITNLPHFNFRWAAPPPRRLSQTSLNSSVVGPDRRSSESSAADLHSSQPVKATTARICEVVFSCSTNRLSMHCRRVRKNALPNGESKRCKWHALQPRPVTLPFARAAKSQLPRSGWCGSRGNFDFHRVALLDQSLSTMDCSSSTSRLHSPIKGMALPRGEYVEHDCLRLSPKWLRVVKKIGALRPSHLRDSLGVPFGPLPIAQSLYRGRGSAHLALII